MRGSAGSRSLSLVKDVWGGKKKRGRMEDGENSLGNVSILQEKNNPIPVGKSIFAQRKRGQKKTREAHSKGGPPFDEGEG